MSNFKIQLKYKPYTIEILSLEDSHTQFIITNRACSTRTVIYLVALMTPIIFSLTSHIVLIMQHQASNLTAAPRQFAAVPCRLAAMPCEWNSSLRPDWPCLGSLTSHVKQTPCLFQMMKWRPVIFYLALLESGANLHAPRSCPESHRPRKSPRKLRVFPLFYSITFVMTFM